MLDRIAAAKQFRQRIFERLPVLADEGKCGIPNRRFWEFYREKKKEFFEACIGVQKKDDGWIIVAYDFVDHEAAAARELQNMLARHSSACSKCNAPCVIEKKLMRNGYPCYRYFCESCWKGDGGLLPHTLVYYLHTHQGVEILDSAGRS